MRKPFYSPHLQAFVLDEMCVCGHLRSQHGSKSIRAKGNVIRLHDEGSCCSGNCACSQFTWIRDVTDMEMADRIIRNRRKCAVRA